MGAYQTTGLPKSRHTRCIVRLADCGAASHTLHLHILPAEVNAQHQVRTLRIQTKGTYALVEHQEQRVLEVVKNQTSMKKYIKIELSTLHLH